MSYDVKNMLRAPGLAKLPIFGENEDGEKIFDFNTLVTMPPELEVEAGGRESKAIEAAIKRVRLYKLDTRPPERRQATELEKLGLKYVRNIILYGYSSWYEWRNAMWGTKWNSYDLKEIDEDTILFTTAINTPEPVIRALVARYPMLTFEHWWSGEEPGHYTGYRVYSAENTAERYDDESQDAFDVFRALWGDTGCIVKEKGCWRRRDCDECEGC